MLGNIEPMQVDAPEENENEADAGAEETEVRTELNLNVSYCLAVDSRNKTTQWRTPASTWRPPATPTRGWPSSTVCSSLPSTAQSTLWRPSSWPSATVRTPSTQLSTRDYTASWQTPWLALPMLQEVQEAQEAQEVEEEGEEGEEVTSLTWL